MAQYVITIDGLAGSGKSTAARNLARRLGFVHLNSGALFRAVAHLALQSGANLEVDEEITALAEQLSFDFSLDADGQTVFTVNGDKLSEELTNPTVSEAASKIATLKKLRQVLSGIQRNFGKSKNIVAEGRDAGSVVFKHSAYKFYLTADLAERARRRQHELGQASTQAVMHDLAARDSRDTSRAIDPALPAPDAILIDTTALGPVEVVERVCELLKKKGFPVP
ncbi:(d)CMP kinase [bacterium]|nr:(d)CMP kinase [bacterium]